MTLVLTTTPSPRGTTTQRSALVGLFGVFALGVLLAVTTSGSSTSWFDVVAASSSTKATSSSSPSFARRTRRIKSNRRGGGSSSRLLSLVSDPKSVSGKEDASSISISTQQPPQHQRTVSFIVQIFNDDGLDFIPTQMSNLKWFIADDNNNDTRIDYHVVIAKTGDDFTERANQVLTSLLGANNVHTCKGFALVQCMNDAFSDVVPLLPKDNLLIHANVDMFLVKQWDPFDYMARLGNPSIAAVIENHVRGSAPYLHPGLLIVNLAKVSNDLEKIRFNANSKLLHGDLGAATPHYLVSHPNVTVKPMVWSRHFGFHNLAKRGLISEKVFNLIVHFMNDFHVKPALAPDLYTRGFSWIHFRDLSCWSGCASNKQEFFHVVLPDFLRALQRVEVSNKRPITPLREADFSCWGCATTTTGHPPPLTSSGHFNATLEAANITSSLEDRPLLFVQQNERIA